MRQTCSNSQSTCSGQPRRAQRRAALCALALCATLHVSWIGAAAGAAGWKSVIEAHSHARAKVGLTYKYDPNLLCSSASVHGRVTKEATERPVHHVNEESFQAYRSARVPVRRANEMWVSDKHRFIYIRTHKSASSSVQQGLYDLFCDGTYSQRCSSVLRKTRGPLGDPDKWRDYFVFTFVRNPFTRMVSAYQYFHNRLRVAKALPSGEVRATREKCEGASFLEFTQNTETIINTCTAAKCCPAKIAFDSVAKERVITVVDYDVVDVHFNDQSHSVFNNEGQSMVDYIGRVEFFDEDWHEIWRLISERNGRRYQVADSIHVNEVAGKLRAEEGQYVNTCGADEFEAMYNETTMHNIAMAYALDLVRFGFAY